MKQQKWEYQLLLVYSFVAVSLPGIALKYNNWNRAHGAQGFSWRPGAVSFGTIDADDDSPLSVALQNVYVPPAGALRILKVPFHVEMDGIILSDPLSQEWPVPIPAGNYALFFRLNRWKHRGNTLSPS